MTLLKKTVAACAVALAGLAATSGHAALVMGTIPGGSQTNQYLAKFTANQAVQGWYGANLFLTGKSDIKIEYFGAEASFLNSFTFGGTTTTHTGGDTITPAGPAVKSFYTVSDVDAGFLDFSFLINGAGAPLQNGSNPDNSVGGTPNFFTTFDVAGLLDTNLLDGTYSSGQSVFLFLDDGAGGRPSDDNHDDYVVRISITKGGTFQVPEPTSLALLGAALLGLGAARRRSAAKQ